MNHRTFIVLGCLAAGGAQATISYSESVSGDLSYLYPGDTTTVLNLGAGQNTVSGRLSSWGDFDTFAFSIPQATQLNSVSLSFSQSTATGYFPSNQSASYGLSSGIGLPYAPYPKGNFAQTVNFSTTNPTSLFPLAAPLGAGTYTIGDFIHNDFSSGFVDYRYTLNIQSLTPPPPAHIPTNYGLFVGARDVGKNGTILLDQNARDMASTFSTRLNSQAYILTGDLTLGNNGKPIAPITDAQLYGTMQAIRSQMLPGDTFTLYINDHGGSLNTTKNPDGTFTVTGYNDKGTGTDVIHIGDDISDARLKTMLGLFDGFKKTVFLDSCHGGGFWGSTDSMEDPLNGGQGFDNQLNQLSNIALYSGAPESGLEYVPPGDSLSYWGEALMAALGTNMTGNELGAYLYKQTRDNAGLSNLLHPNNPVWYELGLGDAIPGDLSLIQPFEANSADYDMNAPLFSSVPEPGSFALVGLGIAGLTWCRRRLSRR